MTQADNAHALGRSLAPRHDTEFFPVGTRVFDMRRGQLGVVMEHDGDLVWLRRTSGGVEWCTRPEDVTTVVVTE